MYTFACDCKINTKRINEIIDNKDYLKRVGAGERDEGTE